VPPVGVPTVLYVFKQTYSGRNGTRQMLECVPAWDSNWTHDCFLVFAWQGGERLIVAVNYASNQSQCHVRLSWRKTL
jgi:hypothetical protein